MQTTPKITETEKKNKCWNPLNLLVAGVIVVDIIPLD